MLFHDAHMHLDFFSDPGHVAQEAANKGLAFFANTVTPRGFESIHSLADDASNVFLGLGMHPWWTGDADIADFDRLLSKTRWIGEVGLDFSPKRAHHDLQLATFEHIAHACAREGSKVLSIHSVRSASVVLDVLERTGCMRTCTCVFHWFSGSTEDLWRAIGAGCWFSVNEMQARTRRAKEQLKLIPADRLLLETDLPPQNDASVGTEEIIASLAKSLELLENIRGEQLESVLRDNWQSLTGV